LLDEVFKADPLFMVKGTELLNTFAPFRVIDPVLAMITPPVAPNGVIHSGPAEREVVVLYCRVAAEPNVGAAETVAVPVMERVPFTVGAVVKVLTPEVERVRLLKVVAFPLKVGVVPLKVTVLVFAVNVPLFVQLPLTARPFDPVIVSDAPEEMEILLHTAPVVPIEG